MAIICREHKLLFIMVPGTGCSVVGKVLQEAFGGTFLPERAVRKNGRVVVQRKHNRLPEILEHGLMTEEERDEYLVFATVRNPFDRWVTYYQRYAGEWVDKYEGFAERQIERDRKRFDLSKSEYRRRKKQVTWKMKKNRRRQRVIRGLGFNVWMTGTLLRWWWDAQESRRGSIGEYAFPMLEGVDAVMYQERLEEGLNEVLQRAGVSRSVRLPRKNKTSGKKPYDAYWAGPTQWLAATLLGDMMATFGYSYDGLESNKAVVQLSDRDFFKVL
jgi:hypothetical protein